MLIEQCEQVLAESRDVRVDEAALASFAGSVDPAALAVPDWSGPHTPSGPPDAVLSWIFSFNAINYCFWPDPGGRRFAVERGGHRFGDDDEATAVMAALAHAIDGGAPLDSPRYLSSLVLDELKRLLAPAHGAGHLPLLEARLAGLRELGAAYRRVGGPRALLEGARGSAPGLVQLLAAECPRWDDARTWGPMRLRFLKRAQLCTAMIHGRLRGLGGPFALRDTDRLTVFADYRLPQLLRGLGILALSGELAATIDAGREVRLGSPAEVSLRAATVAVGERLRQALERPGAPASALAIDYLLWRRAVERDAHLPPFHHTRTIDY